MDFNAPLIAVNYDSAAADGNYFGISISRVMSSLIYALSSSDWKYLPPRMVTLAVSGLLLFSLIKRGISNLS